jgi:superfamily II DNA helicase RecQ
MSFLFTCITAFQFLLISDHAGRNIIFKNNSLIQSIKRRKIKPMVPSARVLSDDAGDTASAELFAKLRAARRRIADERSLPAYLVFSDATLTAMAERRPTTENELLTIPGVGPKKLAAYGAEMLEVIRGG